ncbi:MAG TPA: glutamine-hydrolyzing GMP synthase [Coxiellaceae bacterium]|nr:glutamine-hydrolyzing GMP synthase [Coxiellaceae bacterium]
MNAIHKHRILILDFGSQYTQLIARRIREIGVYCELWAFDASEADIRAFNPRGIILSGGPESVTMHETPRAPDGVFTLGIPVLGICYGLQTMVHQLGGEIEASDEREFGYAQIKVTARNPLLLDIEDAIANDGKPLLDVWMSHGDRVKRLPTSFINIAETSNAPHAAVANLEKHFYGVQFHPEVTHTRQGLRMLEQFVKVICECRCEWTPKHIIEESIQHIQKTVKTDKVLLALSGGVDSSVVAALLHKAIGDRLVCVFVDTGLLRFQEGDQVMDLFAKHLGVNVIRVDAKERFYNALKGIDDPEQKRKRVGEQFGRVFEEKSRELEGIRWLAQGTIYPDVIESAASKTGKAHVIKTHHNVGGLPKDLSLSLLEPLRELFKDEVRKIGLALGLPSELLYRHPFPGPGLCVRVLGEVKPEFVEILQHADHIFIQELRKSGFYEEVSQAFAVFLPVKTVGVKGDQRAYEYVIALRAVETVDFMTAHWAELPHDFLARVSTRILNEVPHVSRVVYDISGKPPATIEWE